MKKISLLVLMTLAFSLSAMAQSTVPKPANPTIENWEEWGTAMEQLSFMLIQDSNGNYVADDYTPMKDINGEPFTILDTEVGEVTYSIYLDDDVLFVFNPEEFSDFDQPTTRIPAGFNGMSFDMFTIYFSDRPAVNVTENRFFTWRIGIQTNYTVDGVTNSSDIVYLEVFPQLHAASQVTGSSFLADWTSAPSTFQPAGFVGYDLHIIDMANPENEIVIADIPSLTDGDDGFGNPIQVAGGTYLVENLAPGTYQYYVVAKHYFSNLRSISSNIQEVTLSDKSAPVMLPADESLVENTAFIAEWTDETPASMVVDYTLYVNAAGPGSTTSLLTEAFGGVTATSDGTTRIDSNLDTYCDNAGWTGTYVYQAGNGGLKFGNSSNGGGLTTPALDLSDCGGTITVTFNAKTYGSDATTVTVSCGEVSQVVELTGESAEYTVVLEGVPSEADQNVTITSSGSRQRWYIYDVNITCEGAGETHVYTGITDTMYLVENLTPGTTYNYYVVANYTDGTSMSSNVETVTLPALPATELIVDPESLEMSTIVGATATATIDVLGADLTGAVTVTLNDENGVYTVTPENFSIVDAEAGAEITVTYAPTAIGTHNATITISTAGVEPIIVPVTGTATLPTAELVMLPADEELVESTAFIAEWTDNMPAEFVTDYTLYVNEVGGEATATTLLTEAFGGVTATSDGTTRIDSNLDTYCDNAGWTGTYVYQAGNGGLKFGNSSNGGGLTTPALDLSDCGGTITVTFNAKTYGSDATTVTVSCGEVSQVVELTGESAEYTVVLEGVPSEADQNVTITSSGSRQRWYIYDVAITTTGEAGESYVFTGITETMYLVENLTPGKTYEYYVVANYVGDNTATSNVETVTLPAASVHTQPGDVNHDGILNITDVTLLISYVLNDGNEAVCPICADVTGEGEVNITDVTKLISMVIDQE